MASVGFRGESRRLVMLAALGRMCLMIFRYGSVADSLPRFIRVTGM
jgi:hypothetical protein